MRKERKNTIYKMESVWYNKTIDERLKTNIIDAIFWRKNGTRLINGVVRVNFHNSKISLEDCTVDEFLNSINNTLIDELRKTRNIGKSTISCAEELLSDVNRMGYISPKIEIKRLLNKISVLLKDI